jgi:hypothetical protein
MRPLVRVWGRERGKVLEREHVMVVAIQIRQVLKS